MRRKTALHSKRIESHSSRTLRSSYRSFGIYRSAINGGQQTSYYSCFSGTLTDERKWRDHISVGNQIVNETW